MKLSANASSVLKKRYLLNDENGKVKETPDELFRRVAQAVASADKLYSNSSKKQTETEDVFFREMTEFRFLPNSPTLMNAGTEISQLSACFVLPLEDSIDEIFKTLGRMAVIHKSGGGTGFSFSQLRPEGDIVKKTTGVASGPVSFMRIFDTATAVVKQGGRRRGANMGILSIDHPDILTFIDCKKDEDFLSNFNISVAITDEFMEKVLRNDSYDLINPRTQDKTGSLNARIVFDKIIDAAWATGDPGLVFIDRINAANPTPAIGRIESTNPCGEQPLLANESCNLGSLNLVKFIQDGEIDWDALRTSVRTAVHFLDNIIDITLFPDDAIKDLTLANRKIGLGVMGFAEALIMMGIRYDSHQSLDVGSKIMEFISVEAISKSKEIAFKRGSFPNFTNSTWQKNGYEAIRNATLTTVAPTGTISIIAGTSSGIEPLFAVSFERHVLEGAHLLETNYLFEKQMHQVGLSSNDLMRRIAKEGSIQNFKEIPENIKDLYVTGFDILPKWHVLMQATFQRHVDNAVSKTVNLANDATVDEVRQIFNLAYQQGCKGITIYRYGSKSNQVLNLGSNKSMEREVFAEAEFSGGCAIGECSF